MTVPTPHAQEAVNLRNLVVAFSYAPWFDSRYVLDDNIIIPFVRADQLPDNIPLFDVACEDFCSLMCAVDTALRTPKPGHRAARKRLVHSCGIH